MYIFRKTPSVALVIDPKNVDELAFICGCKRKNCLSRYNTGKKKSDIVETNCSTDLIQCHSKSMIHFRK